MTINRTNIEHGLWALAMQAAVGLTTGDWFAGACLGVGFFVGREHDQAQQDFARSHGLQLSNVRWYEGFRRWDKDRWMDVLVPLLMTAVVLAMLLFGVNQAYAVTAKYAGTWLMACDKSDG